MASHGNDLPDVLLTFLATPRDILFVANIAAADSPLARWTYAGLGVIPISRVRDARALKARGEDASTINRNAFARVVEALKQGHCVAIFPEGVVSDFPRLGPLRNGAAKMALQAFDDGVVDLQMVPIGYQYENASEWRSGVVGVVGQPVSVANWTPIHPAKRARDFTDLISDVLHLVTRNSRAQHDVEVLSTVSAVAGAVLSTESRTPMAAAHEVQLLISRLSAADRIFVANSFAPSAIEIAPTLTDFQHAAVEFAEIAAKFGARSWSARDQANVLRALGDEQISGASTNVFPLLFLAPFAAVGWAWHTLPWFVSRAIARKFAPRKMELAAITIVPGLYVVLLWYPLAPALLYVFGVPLSIALIIFVLQPRLGDLAMGWRDEWHAWRVATRARGAATSEKSRICELAAQLRDHWTSLQSAAR